MPKDTPLPFASAILGALLGAAPLATLTAQSPNVAAPAGAAVIVIVPDSLDTAPRTVSELLRAYAPAASVQRSSGALGASAFVSLRDASAILGGDPLVVVDGIRQVMTRVNLDTLDRREPSILDDVMVEDIARVEILPGPAAAASYGADGRRGAIVITTRAPGQGGPQFSASVTTSGADANADYARNLSRVNASGFACPYYLEAAGFCAATLTTRYTPLLDRSPFRTAQQLRARLGAVGGLGALGYAASLGVGRGSGTMETDATDHTVASLRLQMPVASIVRVGLSSFATGRGITFPAQNAYSVIGLGVGGGPLDCSPATPCGQDSSSGGYRYPLSWLEQAGPHRRIGHLGGALTVDVDPRPSLSLRTSVTTDMLRDLEVLRTSSPPGYMPLLTEVTAAERSWRVDAAEEGRYTTTVAGAVATTMLSVRFAADRGRSESGTLMVAAPSGPFGGSSSRATTAALLFVDRLSQSLEQRLAWGERAALGAAVLRTTTDFNGGRRPPAVIDPRADAMYELVPADAPLGMLRSLRLRSAWGRTSSHSYWALNTIGVLTGGTAYGGYGYGPRLLPRTPANRSTELEGGFDAAFGPAASRLSVTAFTRTERLDWTDSTADRSPHSTSRRGPAFPSSSPTASPGERGGRSPRRGATPMGTAGSSATRSASSTCSPADAPARRASRRSPAISTWLDWSR